MYLLEFGSITGIVETRSQRSRHRTSFILDRQCPVYIPTLLYGRYLRGLVNGLHLVSSHLQERKRGSPRLIGSFVVGNFLTKVFVSLFVYFTQGGVTLLSLCLILFLKLLMKNYIWWISSIRNIQTLRYIFEIKIRKRNFLRKYNTIFNLLYFLKFILFLLVGFHHCM